MKLTSVTVLFRRLFVTYHDQALGKPMIRIAHVRKLASQTASPINRLEKEFRRFGRKSTRIDIKVPIRPKKETVVNITPST